MLRSSRDITGTPAVELLTLSNTICPPGFNSDGLGFFHTLESPFLHFTVRESQNHRTVKDRKAFKDH